MTRPDYTNITITLQVPARAVHHLLNVYQILTYSIDHPDSAEQVDCMTTMRELAFIVHHQFTDLPYQQDEQFKRAIRQLALVDIETNT